jgi:ABC-type transport system involved in multi-copper enzyme maturation permease subunit
VRTIVALDGRTALGGRSIVLLILASLPILLLGARALFEHARTAGQLAEDEVVFAVIYRTLVLRLVVFFGCVVVFTRLFRGEVLDRSLHYYFLAPVRREVLVAGKFLSGLLTALVLFVPVTAVSWLLLYVPLGTGGFVSRVTSGQGVRHLLAYCTVTTLACIGYGALFLLSGIALRNPVVPAVLILAWESLNALLPPLLKKISVIHYLESLCPVPLPAEKISILATPAPPAVAVPGILALAAVVLVAASWFVRRMEVLYGTE